LKYDVIVTGGGPGGLTAAWNAAASGLKTLLIERKKDIPVNTRECGMFTNINMISVSGIYKYAYSEPLHLEIGTAKNMVHWPAIGFSMEYKGPLKPYLNYIHFSPSGNVLYRIKDRFFSFYWEKDSLLKGLLDNCIKAGVTVLNDTVVRSGENTPDGVSVTVESGGKTATYTASKLIVAEGKASKTAEQLGIVKKISNTPVQVVGYVVEGMNTSWCINSWVCFTIPSLSPVGNLWLHQDTGDRYVVGTTQNAGFSASEATEKLFKLPAFESWFSKIKVVKKVVATLPAFYEPAQTPFKDNILLLGESAGLTESSNPGAVACGYQAAQAVKKELNGQSGFADYAKWWQNAFEGLMPTYGKASARFFALNSMCTDDEVDYMYKKFEGIVGVPAITISNNLEQIKADRPSLYEKLKNVGFGGQLQAIKADLTTITERKMPGK